MGEMSLDAYLDAGGYGTAFREDHLYPMAAAIWSTPAAEIGEYPARAFIRFCQNHGLLQLVNRPLWRTLTGGSRAYVEKLAEAIPEIMQNTPVSGVRRHPDSVEVMLRGGEVRRFDQVVIGDTRRSGAQNAGRSEPRGEADARRLSLLREQSRAASDATLMPRRRRVWSSWNYLSSEAREQPETCRSATG